MPTPNNLPKPKPTHARKRGGYVTQSAGFSVSTSLPTPVDSPKAIRVPRGSMRTRHATQPVTVTVLTGEELAARKATLKGQRR